MVCGLPLQPGAGSGNGFRRAFHQDVGILSRYCEEDFAERFTGVVQLLFTYDTITGVVGEDNWKALTRVHYFKVSIYVVRASSCSSVKNVPKAGIPLGRPLRMLSMTDSRVRPYLYSCRFKDGPLLLPKPLPSLP